MSDLLGALRAAAADEARLAEPSDVGPPHPDSARLDLWLEAFFAEEPPSETWLAVLEDIALRGPTVDRGPSVAAKTAHAARPARPVSVEGALQESARVAREHLQVAFHLGADAAEELLERPAAALSQRPPEDVRQLAMLAQRPAAALFADIAASWRASAGYVYACLLYTSPSPRD